MLPNVVETAAIASRVAANTSLAAAAGGTGAMLINLAIVHSKTKEISFDLTKTMNGTLAGLVAITAACGTVELWASIFIGAVAGALYLLGSHLLIKLRLDDVVDGIPVHMLGGAWGMIATGFFSSPAAVQQVLGHSNHVGLFYELGSNLQWDATLLTNQMLAVFSIGGLMIVTMVPFFLFLNYQGLLRSNDLEQVVGLDIRYHANQEVEEIEKEIERDVAKYQESFKIEEARLLKKIKTNGSADNQTVATLNDSEHSRKKKNKKGRIDSLSFLSLDSDRSSQV
jgi:ammonium transporter, Amt family